jgi:hypothetical protein
MEPYAKHSDNNLVTSKWASVTTILVTEIMGWTAHDSILRHECPIGGPFTRKDLHTKY